MGSLRGTEVYYQKFIELQEKLRKSEEERLKLEMKFNEMVQCTREEEQAHYRKLRQQYKRFLDEDRRRQERNEAILRALDRVEGRASVLAAKTERYKFLRKQYQNFIERLQDAPKVEAVAKRDASEEAGLLYRHISEETPKKFKEEETNNCYYKSAQNVPKDVRNEIIEKYLQSLNSVEPKTNLVRKSNQRYPFTMTSDCTDYLREQNGLQNAARGNKTSAVVDEIMQSIYSKKAGFGEESGTKNGFLSNKDNEFLDGRNRENDHRQYFARSGDHDFLPNQQLRRFDESYSNEMVAHEANHKPAEVVKNLSPSHHVKFTSGVQEERKTFELSPLTDVFKNYNQKHNEVLRQSCAKSEDLDDNFNKKCFQNDVLENVQQAAISKTEENERIKPANILEDHKEVEVIAKELSPRELHEALPESEDVYKTEEESEVKIHQEAQQSENQSKEVEDIQSEKNGKAIEKQESLQAESGEIFLQSEIKIPTVQMHTDDSYAVASEGDMLTAVENVDRQQGQKYYETAQEQIEEHNENVQQLSNQYKFDGSEAAQNQSGQPLQQYNNENDQLVHQHNTESQPVQQNNENNQQCDEDSQLLPQHDNADDEKLVKNENGDPQKQQLYDESGQYFQQYDESGQSVQQYYDESGQPLQYDENGQPLQYDENGQPVQYDENGQPLQYDVNSQPLQYDENGQPVQYDENGQPLQYDENNQPVQYDENGQPIQYDENGQPIQYDEKGQPYNQYSIYGQDQSQVMYDETGAVVQQYDEYGQPIQYDQQYDENAQLIQQSYDEHNQQYYGYDESGQPIEQYQQEYASESAQRLNEDTVKSDSTDMHHEIENQQKYPDKGAQPVDEQPVLSETNKKLKEGNHDIVEPDQTLKEQDKDVEDEKKPHKVMEMLDTDTENSRQDTKESHDSDFDFSASQK